MNRSKKRQPLTKQNIEQDIKNSLKEPAQMSEAAYRKWTIPCILIVAALLIFDIFYPVFVLWSLLLILVIIVAFIAWDHLPLRYKRGRVCIDDYEIVDGTISHTAREEYKVHRAARHRRHYITVINHTLHFECGESWRIPKENYAWSEELLMSDAFLFEQVHRGDAFILVRHTKTGKIAMAYPESLFEYKA